MEKIQTVIVAVLCALIIAICTTGCQFRIGFDYNGQTGVDNRTQTELLKYKTRSPIVKDY